jgi:hypothetical protein
MHSGSGMQRSAQQTCQVQSACHWHSRAQLDTTPHQPTIQLYTTVVNAKENEVCMALRLQQLLQQHAPEHKHELLHH